MRLWPKRPEATLTEDAYLRWLHACRPQPLSWFLGLAVHEQQVLAGIGSKFTEGILLDIGYAVADPKFAEACVGAVEAAEEGTDGDPSHEAALLRQLLASAAGAALSRDKPAPAATMAGTGASRSASVFNPPGPALARSFLDPSSKPQEGAGK